MGFGTLTAVAASATAATANLPAIAVLSSTGISATAATANLAVLSSGSVSSTGISATAALANLTAFGTLTAAGVSGTAASASLIGFAPLSAAAISATAGTANLAGIGPLTAAAISATAATADPTGSLATLTAISVSVTAAVASLGTIGTLSQISAAAISSTAATADLEPYITPVVPVYGSNAPTMGGGGGDKDGHRYIKPWSGKLEFKGDIDKEIAAEWARIRYGDPEEPAPAIRPVEMPKRPLLTRKGIVTEPEKPRDEEDDEVALLMIDAYERGLAMMALSLLRRLK